MRKETMFKLLACLVALSALGYGLQRNVPPRNGPPETVSLRVTALEAEVSSIKLPIEGKWVDTGPIKVVLSDAPTRLVGRMTPRGRLGEQTTATMIWPVSISAPLLKKMGIEKMDVFFIGIAKRVPTTDTIVAVDFTAIQIPAKPGPTDPTKPEPTVPDDGPIIIIQNFNTVARVGKTGRDPKRPEFWLGRPGAELHGTFDLTEAAFRGRDVNVRELQREALKVASSFIDITIPTKDVDSFLDTALRLHREKMHEIVVYFPEYDSYQTADLRGTVSLRVGR